ncbi:unnamed protein product [Spirodela intermedia]|uniref:Uncharacterized protein n=2 Tax=Spirodela intermedia TaxID=51605 RepID=A0A7I8JG12_SPIIN|nr:unnamed protein product [Spirodela intermedia]CAA6669100.1 unnamed protein product [Spirodela intermedia]CAA7406049.1 unnamed protein product [Spirodela intermedia]
MNNMSQKNLQKTLFSSFYKVFLKTGRNWKQARNMNH